MKNDVVRRSGDLSGWSLATALALVATAFLIDRLAPTGQTETSLQRETERGASLVGLANDKGDRGRGATSPSNIPARGWGDVLLRVYEDIGDHRMALASGMTTTASSRSFRRLLLSSPFLSVLVVS